jgi:uncharacterized membrane protein
MAKGNFGWDGRGYGVMGKILASWLVLVVIFILFYEFSINGTIPTISQEYIMIGIIAFILIIGYNLYRAKFCKRVPRGRGRRQGIFN